MQRAFPVPGRHCSLIPSSIKMLGKERTMKAGFTPATKDDKGRVEVARRFENQDYCAVQLPFMEQPMSHPRLSRFTFSGGDFYTLSGAKPSYDMVLGDVSHDTGRWPSLSSPHVHQRQGLLRFHVRFGGHALLTSRLPDSPSPFRKILKKLADEFLRRFIRQISFLIKAGGGSITLANGG
jgi:hypothetical protein